MNNLQPHEIPTRIVELSDGNKFVFHAARTKHQVRLGRLMDVTNKQYSDPEADPDEKGVALMWAFCAASCDDKLPLEYFLTLEIADANLISNACQEINPAWFGALEANTEKKSASEPETQPETMSA